MNFCLYLICMASAGGVSAWYNTSSLDSCSSNNVWDQIDDFVETTIEELRKIRLDPIEPSRPYSEGEYYTTLNRNVSIQCKLPNLPAQSLIALTYNSSYMADMKTANTKRRKFCKNRNNEVVDNCEVEVPSEGYEACTITVLDPFSTLIEVQEIPLHLPPKCEQSRLDNLEINTNEMSSKEKILNLLIKKVGNQEAGTYQCSILRTCQPQYDEHRDMSAQAAVSVSKQMYVKVYEWPDYTMNLMVASSVLGTTTMLLIISTILATQKEDRIDHL